jgi:predicted nucleotidyltransferase
MPDVTFDPIGLLHVLNEHGVRYVVIGGFAAVAYGSPLPTVDVDVTPDRSIENLARLSSALEDLDARIRVEGIVDGLIFKHDAESLGAVRILNLITRLGELDLVMVPAGDLDYTFLASRAVTVDLHGTEVPLASLDDVIVSKEAADRAKDRVALPILRQLRERISCDQGPVPDSGAGH